MGKKIIIKGADFSRNALPKEYTVLSWIQATSGGQTFESNVLRTQNMKLEATFAVPADYVIPTTSWDYMAGNPSSGDSNIYLGYNNNKRCYGYIQGISVNTSTSGLINDNNFHVVAVSDDGIELDGVIKGTFSGSTTMGGDATSPLFFVGMGAQYPSALRFSEFKVWSDKDDPSSLILHLKPVKKSDGTVCLINVLTGDYLYTMNGTNPNYGE